MQGGYLDVWGEGGFGSGRGEGGGFVDLILYIRLRRLVNEIKFFMMFKRFNFRSL